ncbi:MAG: DMT family transporter [Pseudomonadota bacterium]
MTHFLDGTSEDRPSLAASLMMLALIMLAVQDSLARLTGEEMSFWQFQMLRAGSNLILFLGFAFAIWRGLPRRPVRAWAVWARVFMMVLATVFFFGGIPTVTIVEMAAGLYTFPIFVTILSAVLLRERVGIRRYAAVLVGATGAMLILQPGGDDFEWVKLLPIGAGLSYGCSVILTRRWLRGENAVTIGAAQALVFVLVGAAGCIILSQVTMPQSVQTATPYLANGWLDAAGWAFGAVLICSILNASGNVLLTKAYQSAESSWLAPFDYSYLIFATIVGYLMFGTVPDIWQGLGVVLIFGAGTFTAMRERRLKQELADDLGSKLPPPGSRA